MPNDDARQAHYQRMAASDDPVLREMGVQLSEGSRRPSDLLTVPAYREVVMRGLRRLADTLEREHSRLGLPSPREATDVRGHPADGGSMDEGTVDDGVSG